MNDKIKDIITKIELGRTGFCGLNSLIRIDNKDLGNLDNYCENCVFRDMLREEVCFTEVKQEVRGLLK